MYLIVKLVYWYNYSIAIVTFKFPMLYINAQCLYNKIIIILLSYKLYRCYTVSPTVYIYFLFTFLPTTTYTFQILTIECPPKLSKITIWSHFVTKIGKQHRFVLGQV